MSSSNTPYRKRTILVVTNNAKIRQPLSLLLSRLSYEAAIAEDANQAFAFLTVRHADCLIAEFLLPGITGRELLQKVQLARPRTPVVFLIPASDAAAESQCQGYGAAGCVLKPVQAEQLYTTLQIALEPRPRASIRIETTLPVTLNNAPVAGAGGCLVDLSEQGMYLPLRETPGGGQLDLRMQFHDRTIATQASVLYTDRPASGHHREPGVGLKFLSLTPQDRDYLRRYIRDEVTRGT